MTIKQADSSLHVQYGLPSPPLPLSSKAVVRRWDPSTEDLTEEGISHETIERIRAGTYVHVI